MKRDRWFPSTDPANLGIVSNNGQSSWRIYRLWVLSNKILRTQSHCVKRDPRKFTNCVRRAGRNNVFIRARLLQGQPHRVHVILRSAPIYYCIEVAEQQWRGATHRCVGGCSRDLRCHEFGAAAWRLVIVQNANGGKNAERFAVIAAQMNRRTFADRVQSFGTVRRFLRLRCRQWRAEDMRAGSVKESACWHFVSHNLQRGSDCQQVDRYKRS